MRSPTMMLAPKMLLAPKRCIAAAAVAVVVSLMVGCDTEQSRAEKATIEQLNKAASAAAAMPEADETGKNINAQEIALSTLKSASTDLQTALNSAKNAPKSTLANANQAVAVNTLNQVLVAETEFRNKTGEIAQTLLAIQTNLDLLNTRKTTMGGLAKLDPASTLATLKKTLADIQGGAEATWKTPNEEVSLPTLASTRAKVTELEGQITAAQQQIATIDQNRSKAIGESEQSLKAAENAKGQAAVDAFVAAANARHQADDLAIDKGVVEKNIVRMKQDLEASKNIEAGLANAAAQMEARIAAVEAEWKATQETMTKDKAAQTDLVSGGAEAKIASLKTLDAKLEMQLKDWRDLKSALINDLGTAEHTADAAVDAAKASRTLVTDGNAGPFKSEWRTFKEVTDPANYGRTGAATRDETAAIHSLSAEVLAQVIRLQTQAATTLPTTALNDLKTLGAKDATVKEFDEAVAAADEKFDAAKDELQGYASGDAPKFTQRMAQADQLLTLAAAISHRRLMADFGKTYSGEQTPEKLLETARTVKEELQSNNVSLPAIPGELGQGKPVSASPTGSETPTTPGATPETPAVPGTPTTPTDGTTPATPTTPTPEGVTPAAPPAEVTPTEPTPTVPPPGGEGVPPPPPPANDNK